MTVEFNDKEFLKKVKSKELKFLHAVGQASVNQAVNLSHVITGLSRNAKHYVLTDGISSKYGDLPGKDGVVRQPPMGIKGTPPKKLATVKVVAPLKYDVYLERGFAILKKSMFEVRPTIRALAKRILKI